MSIADELATLASNAAGADAQIAEDLAGFEEWGSIQDIKRIFIEFGVAWGPLVGHDAQRILHGDAPEYFMSPESWVQRYRDNHRVLYEPPARKPRFVYGASTTEWEPGGIAQRRKDSHKDLGWACPIEQSYFYQTDEWSFRAKAARYEANYKCARCGTIQSELHAHHENPIISAYHHNFINNFAYWKLTVLCEKCHKQVHETSMRGIWEQGFTDAGSAEIKEQRARLRNAWSALHAAGECVWCNSRAQITGLARGRQL